MYLGQDRVLVRALVRAAFFAAADLCAGVRFLALERACLDSALRDAAECPSFRNARLTAVARFRETFLRPPRLAFAVSRAAWRRVRGDALPLFGGGSFTPERRALESPIAIACLVDRAPCFPSLTWCISSRTNSPAWVEGAFPSRASSCARSTVSVSGTFPPDRYPTQSREPKNDSSPVASFVFRSSWTSRSNWEPATERELKISGVYTGETRLDGRKKSSRRKKARADQLIAVGASLAV
jgi:hypothetical protein